MCMATEYTPLFKFSVHVRWLKVTQKFVFNFKLLPDGPHTKYVQLHNKRMLTSKTFNCKFQILLRRALSDKVTLTMFAHAFAVTLYRTA